MSIIHTATEAGRTCTVEDRGHVGRVEFDGVSDKWIITIDGRWLDCAATYRVAVAVMEDALEDLE